MNPKTLMSLAIAGGCGVLAMFAFKQASDGGGSAEPEIKVLVAINDIPVGVPLDDTMVTWRPLPKSAVPEGVIVTAEQYADRALRIPAVAGETIMRAKLGKPGETGIGMTIPDGFRVVYLEADGSNSFSNLLKPGERVDVGVVFEVEIAVPGQTRPRKEFRSKTLLEYIEVFSVNDQTYGTTVAKNEEADKEAAEFEVEQIGLLMNPEQANYFKLAEQKAEINLTWRSKSDVAKSSGGVADSTILEDLNIGGPNDATSRTPSTLAADPVEAEAFEEQMDFDEFLNEDDEDLSQLFQVQEPTPTEPVYAEPMRPVWTMNIYRDGEPEQFEVYRMETAPKASAPKPTQAQASSAAIAPTKAAAGFPSLDLPQQRAEDDATGMEMFTIGEPAGSSAEDETEGENAADGSGPAGADASSDFLKGFAEKFGLPL